MTPEQKKIYLFITENPNSKVIDVVMATKLSKSLCYKFLSSPHFLKTKNINKNGKSMTYTINDERVVSMPDLPNHHYIHQAFWRMAA
jgi:hypothetical protein